MNRTIAVSILVVLAASAQNTADRPHFEVAAVQLSAMAMNPFTLVSGGVQRGERYDLRKATMLDMIRIAYDVNRWAQLLTSILVSYPGGNPLTLADVRAGTTNPPWARFQGFPLAQLALKHLPEKAAETLVWREVFADLPTLTDEPYHPLFAYNPSFALHGGVSYVSHCRDDPTFLKAVRTALREDRAGSSYLASILTSEGQMACLADALGRAMKVIRRRRPTATTCFPPSCSCWNTAQTTKAANSPLLSENSRLCIRTTRRFWN